MNAIDCLLKRCSVPAASLCAPGPSEEHLNQIVQAGLRVPDHGIIQPWRIQKISSNGQQALGELYAALFSRDNPGAPEQQVEFQRQRALRAPTLIVVTTHPDPAKFDKVPLIEQQLSAGAICQNMLLAAFALGYGAQWLTGWPAYHPEVRRALGHSDDTLIAGFIFIGTRPEGTPPERVRPNFTDIVSDWDGPAG
jgi:nitroreductase